MMPPIVWRHSVEGTILLLALSFLFGSIAMRDVFRTKRMILFYAALASFFFITHAMWQLGPTYPIRYSGACLTVCGLLTSMIVAASLPVAAILRGVAKPLLLRKKSSPIAASASSRPEKSVDESAVTRRQVLGAITAVAPVVALGVSARGFLDGIAPAEVPRIMLHAPSLPEDLQGLTILQLSDLHLGISRQACDLDKFVDRLGDRGIQPDLVLFTGDVADDLSQIRPAIEAARRLKPRLGVFSALGNHEYIHDAAVARRYLEKARANLLVDAGVPIRVGGSTLYLGGVDDPFLAGGDFYGFLRRGTERAMRDRPSGAFSILMSHRPEGFIPAADANVDLTLSGHTHGGQIGFHGKSAFQPLFPDGYLWGRYERGASTLYTTSGWGHWFPFRVGCPAEAPLIVLG